MSTITALLAAAQQHHQAGRLPEADRLYREILQQQPNQPTALYLLGLMAHQVGHLEDAIAHYERALTAQPNYLDAHNNLGAALQQQGRLDAAIQHYQAVLRLHPHHPHANVNLGVALQKQGKLEAAIARYQKAMQLNPRLPEAHSNLGHALKERGDFEQAIAHYRMALQLTPADPEACRHLAEALQEQGWTAEAIALLDQAILQHPQHTQLQGSRIRARLMAGHLRDGFAEYDPWRLARSARSFNQPQWDGSDLEGRSILLYVEPGAGLGDTMQFVRYAPLVAQRGGRVIVECQEPLLRLLETVDGIDTLMATGSQLPAFDVQASLLSLPHIFRTTLATIPATVPYLHAVARHGTASGFQLPISDAPYTHPPLNVGIVWGGDPNHLHDQERSCPLFEYHTFLKTPGVTFYSLQKGVHRLELEQAGDLPIHDLSDYLNDFADTATAIAQLDLVVSVDTAVAHLAGAMAKPVWVLLPFAADWRWLLRRSDTPWYPTAQLFRQPCPHDWASVCAEVAQALDRLVNLHSVKTQ